jgi:hypothetical protein
MSVLTINLIIISLHPSPKGKKSQHRNKWNKMLAKFFGVIFILPYSLIFLPKQREWPLPSF